MENKIKEKLFDRLEQLVVGILGIYVIQLFPRGNLEQNKDIVGVVLQFAVALFFLLIFLLFQSLKRKVFRPGLSLLPQGIVKPEGFALSWQQSILFGTLIYIAALELVGAIAGFILGYFFGQIAVDELYLGLIPVSIIASCLIAFFVGRWLGMRVYNRGFVAMVAVVFIGHMVVALIDIAVLPALTGEPVPPADLLNPIALGILAIRVIFGAFGYWRGQKARQAAYLGYLANALSTDTRQAIVELVYEEVQRTPASRKPLQSTPAGGIG